MDLIDTIPRLVTERLVLREARLTDAPAMFHILSDPEVTRFYNVETFTDLSQAVRLIKTRQERFREGQSMRWVITLKDEDEMIGSCGFQPWYQGWRMSEIGYELHRSYWRRGIMREALVAMLAYGFSHLSLNRVEAQVVPANEASCALLHRLGFQREGVLRQRGFWNGQFQDLAMFSILKAEFESLFDRPEAVRSASS